MDYEACLGEGEGAERIPLYPENGVYTECCGVAHGILPFGNV